eukprot:CCRYP_020429-RA/>CCRYP_020429-RA protein AED:0.16 eAED:0.16 QI:219/1/1/1/0/0/2/0/291
MAVKSPSSLRHRYHHSRGAPLYLMLVVLLFVVSLYFHLQKLKNTLPNLFSTDPSSRLTSKPSKASTTDVVNAQGTERVDEVVSNLTSVKITNCSGRGLDERSNKKCYVFWSGPPMDGARKGAFEKMKALIEYDCDVFVQLVTRDNLLSFENPERPLHPAVLLQPGLSGVHFSDYLRSYFMHNHGGCYHDIKVLTGPPKLGELFERMAKNESIYMIGAPEGGPEDIGCDHDYARLLNVTCEYVVGKWKSLLSNGAPFTSCWALLSRTGHQRLPDFLDRAWRKCFTSRASSVF